MGILKWVPPVIIHFNGISHEINHPAIKGYLNGNPSKMMGHLVIPFGSRTGSSKGGIAARSSVLGQRMSKRFLLRISWPKTEDMAHST